MSIKGSAVQQPCLPEFIAGVGYELLLCQIGLGMPIRNTIKALAAAKGDDTNYKFWKRSGLPQSTAYRIYRNSDVYPSAPVLEVICQVYGVQPGDCLEYVPEDES